MSTISSALSTILDPVTVDGSNSSSSSSGTGSSGSGSTGGTSSSSGTFTGASDYSQDLQDVISRAVAIAELDGPRARRIRRVEAHHPIWGGRAKQADKVLSDADVGRVLRVAHVAAIQANCAARRDRGIEYQHAATGCRRPRVCAPALKEHGDG